VLFLFVLAGKVLEALRAGVARAVVPSLYVMFDISNSLELES
jgi:hypothetical protein